MRKGLLRRRGSGLRRSEDLNPIEGAFNLVDAMLVFSCGLMVALILRWNVQLVGVNINPADTQEVTQDIEDSIKDPTNVTNGTGYEEMGMVYRDPETGKMYLLTDGEGGQTK